MSIKILSGFLKNYVPLYFRLYFKRFKVLQRRNVPHKGPVIFAPNHQNAFIDAVLVAASTPRSPWFLTRASVFKHPVARYWLNALKMIPIYRFRDGLNNVKKNDEVIENCIQLLRDKKSLLIFPEGNHDMRWHLRPLQKGIARIAFAAESANNFQLDLKIIPVGIQYENHTRIRSDVLLNYGRPLSIADYKDIHEMDPMQATDKLLNDLGFRMQKLIVDINKELDHDEVKKIIQAAPERPKKLSERLIHDRKIIEQYQVSGIKSGPIAKESTKRNFSSIFLKIMGFPVFLYGFINHLIFILISKWIINKLVGDTHFMASVKIVLVMFLAPLLYILQCLLVQWIFGDLLVTLIYLISLPVTGLLSYHYYATFIRQRYS